MKTFYSILYVPIRPEVKERLTIGLFMRSEKQVIFRFSNHKMEVLNHLLPKQAYNLLKLSLHSIERAVDKTIQHFDDTIDSLLPKENLDYNLVGEPYFQYLSKYNQNLVAFSTPQEIKLTVNIDNFRELYDKLIFEGEFIQKKSAQKVDIVKSTRSLLKPKIEKNVNWDFKVTNKHFSNLILPSVYVDFIGKNGKYVTGKTIDFEKPEHSLDNYIAKHITLIGAIKSENDQSKCFIIGKEPNKSLVEQHILWKNIKASNLMDFVDADEYELVSDFICSNEVQPIETLA